MRSARPAGAVVIRRLHPTDGPACDRVILSLPYHFGHEGGRQQCAEAVRTGDGLAAVLDGEVVGFLTVERCGAESAEITWLAVEMAHRRRGIGRALVARLVSLLRGEGRRVLLVHTASSRQDETGVTDGYAGTRAFYRRLGFVEAREYPDLWPASPAVLFVLPLAAPLSAMPPGGVAYGPGQGRPGEEQLR